MSERVRVFVRVCACVRVRECEWVDATVGCSAFVCVRVCVRTRYSHIQRRSNVAPPLHLPLCARQGRIARQCMSVPLAREERSGWVEWVSECACLCVHVCVCGCVGMGMGGCGCGCVRV